MSNIRFKSFFLHYLKKCPKSNLSIVRKKYKLYLNIFKNSISLFNVNISRSSQTYIGTKDCKSQTKLHAGDVTIRRRYPASRRSIKGTMRSTLWYICQKNSWYLPNKYNSINFSVYFYVFSYFLRNLSGFFTLIIKCLYFFILLG